MKKILMATVLFGSIWGFLECSVGDWLHGYDLSVLMAVMAIFLMAYTRRVYNQPGMQAGMALVAALLRHFNPMGACLICASIAIFVEGVAFEIIWALPWRNYKSYAMKAGMGVISFYAIYTVGYIATQILTPLLTAKFYWSDLTGVMPKILSHATIAGVIGAFALPAAYASLDVSIKDRLYYPVAAVITALCWIAVIAGI